MSGELGKASLELSADLGSFDRNIEEAHGSADRLQHALDTLAAVADVCQRALNDVKLSGTHAVESRVLAEGILAGVHGVSDEARTAARELDRVKLGETQAAQTEEAALQMDRSLDGISRNADQARRKLDEVRLAARRGPLSVGGTSLPLLGVGIGAGVLAAPAAAPALVGLLAGIPALASVAAGALGVLALAGSGVAKAIGGDKKAFDALEPSAKKFVLTVRSLDGFLDKLKQRAGAAVFPGLTAGLKAALSPGTISAVEQAITAIGHSIGAVGAEFGRYFGSSKFQKIFGPLMASAARNIGVLSDAFLHLFDALGVIARAAIPFTNWVASAIDKGAKLADAWTHAQAASGGLARGMDAARTSLTLVAKVVGGLFDVVVALGRALYPVSNVALKDLVDGLHGLAGVIRRNQADIRGIVGGALKVFVGAVKAAATGVGVLWHGLEGLIGHKALIVGAIAAIGAVILSTLGPNSLAIGGAIGGALIAIGEIKDHWRTIVVFFKTLGKEILLGFEYLWYQIERLALIAALKIVEPFSHLPSFLGGWARKAKDSMQHQLDKIRPPDMNWHDVAVSQGAATGNAWAQGFSAQTAAALAKAKKDGGTVLHRSGLYIAPHKHHPHKGPKPGTHAWYIQHLGYDPTQADTSSPFGKQPPFTTNTGSAAHHRRHHLSVAQRAQERLQFALDRAKEAVQSSQLGTKAYDRAVGAEEEALHAEVNYWAKRAHNLDLSLKARDEALRKELKYQKQLQSLIHGTAKTAALAATANEAQFLQTLSDIENSFGSNATPLPGKQSSGKATTHLYEIKNELRQQTPLLRKAVDRARFSASYQGVDSAMAVTG